jgi:hypothetical protein
MINKPIEAMNIMELKATAYDVIGELERLQGILRKINETISKKLEEEKQVPEPPKKPQVNVAPGPAPANLKKAEKVVE